MNLFIEVKYDNTSEKVNCHQLKQMASEIKYNRWLVLVPHNAFRAEEY